MATIKQFEDLEIWQLARILNQRIYPILKKLEAIKDYELKGQLESSSGSTMDNVAEGFEREGNKEFVEFLYYSKGSLGEVKSQIYRTFDRNLISKAECDSIHEDCNLLSGKISKLIQYLQSSSYKGNKYKARTQGVQER